jgi:hypothetical protein
VSLTTYEAAAYAWLVAAVNDASKEVVFGQDSGTGTSRVTGPEPDDPHVILRTTSLTEVGTSETDPKVTVTGVAPNEVGSRVIYDRYEAAVGCQFVGQGGRELGIACRRALQRSDVLQTFAAADMGHLRSSELISVPDNSDGNWRQRWAFDAFFDIPDSQTETLSWIEHVEIEMTVQNAGGVVTVNENFTVDI